MPLSKCIRACWDSQKTKLYSIGDIADYPEDHVFLTGGSKGQIKCFEVLKAEDLLTSKDDPESKIRQLSEILAKQQREIESLKVIRPDEIVPEEKRPVGRPPKSGG